MGVDDAAACLMGASRASLAVRGCLNSLSIVVLVCWCCAVRGTEVVFVPRLPVCCRGKHTQNLECKTLYKLYQRRCRSIAILSRGRARHRDLRSATSSRLSYHLRSPHWTQQRSQSVGCSHGGETLPARPLCGEQAVQAVLSLGLPSLSAPQMDSPPLRGTRETASHSPPSPYRWSAACDIPGPVVSAARKAVRTDSTLAVVAPARWMIRDLQARQLTNHSNGQTGVV